jgi:ABC-type nitrate/sulfonate/bicarbonate transport system substrate-binding protein
VVRLSRLAMSVLLRSLPVADVAAAEPLKIRYSVWVGYGPLFLAQEREYFEEEKVTSSSIRRGRGDRGEPALTAPSKSRNVGLGRKAGRRSPPVDARRTG